MPVTYHGQLPVAVSLQNSLPLHLAAIGGPTASPCQVVKGESWEYRWLVGCGLLCIHLVSIYLHNGAQRYMGLPGHKERYFTVE
jgi:hypothetical protein